MNIIDVRLEALLYRILFATVFALERLLALGVSLYVIVQNLCARYKLGDS